MLYVFIKGEEKAQQCFASCLKPALTVELKLPDIPVTLQDLLDIQVVGVQAVVTEDIRITMERNNR